MKKQSILLLALFGSTLVGCSGISDSIVSDKTSDGTTDTTRVSESSLTSSSTSENQTGNTYQKLKSCFTQQDFASLTSYPYMPSKGDINVLVIPVVVSDYQSNATEKVRSDLQKTLFGEESETGWESLSSYYRKSSYGQLNIQGTVSDWYNPGLSSTEMAELDQGNGEYSTSLLQKAISWYKTKYKTDCKEFDNNNDGFLDGVFLIYSADDYNTAEQKGETLDEGLFWAYTTMDYDAEGSLSSPVGGYYFWASYDFMYEGYGTEQLDSHTFVHETGHMLSLDDYYSYTTKDKLGYQTYNPLGGADMMDYNIIEQDCFSKFVLGWNEPYVIDKEGTITIESGATSLDCILIPTKKQSVSSSYEEYVMLELFSPLLGLNQDDIETDYGLRGFDKTLSKEGVRAYHVDNRICYFNDVDTSGNPLSPKYADLSKTDPEKYYYVQAHSNSPAGYYDGSKTDSFNYMNAKYRLITQLSAKNRVFGTNGYELENQDFFFTGSTFSPSTMQKQFPNGTLMNNGSELAYSFHVDSIQDHKATITFTKN